MMISVVVVAAAVALPPIPAARVRSIVPMWNPTWRKAAMLDRVHHVSSNPPPVPPCFPLINRSSTLWKRGGNFSTLNSINKANQLANDTNQLHHLSRTPFLTRNHYLHSRKSPLLHPRIRHRILFLIRIESNDSPPLAIITKVSQHSSSSSSQIESITNTMSSRNHHRICIRSRTPTCRSNQAMKTLSRIFYLQKKSMDNVKLLLL